MRSVLAIASVAIRGAIRSKVLWILAALIVLALVGLPLTIKGDGTVEGYVHVLLYYTLGFVWILLAIATVWAGCSAISMDIEQKQIQLVASKPVSRLRIWLGKWLGVLALDAVVLLFAAVVLLALLNWNIRPGRWPAEERENLRRHVLVAREGSVPVVPPDMQQRIASRVEELRQLDETATMPRHQLQLAVEQDYRRQRDQVRPGDTTRWIFRPVQPALAGKKPLQVAFMAGSSDIGSATLPVIWRTRDADGRILSESVTTLTTGRAMNQMLPPAAVASDGLVRLECENPSPRTTLLFGDDGLELLSYRGSFEMNLLRTLFVAFCHLAFLAAVGITMGAFFSVPVAACTSMVLLVITGMDSYIHDMAQQAALLDLTRAGPLKLAFHQFLLAMFQVMDLLVKPLQGPNVLEWLATGRLVGWSLAGSTLLVRVVLYGGLLALAGSWVFNRRELALPSR